MTLPRLPRRLSQLLRHPLLLELYVPAVLFATSVGIMGPLLPLYAADFDVPYGVIGLVLAAETIGTLVGDVPAGMLIKRLGQKRIMALGLGLNGLMMTGLYLAPNIIVAAILLFFSGMGWALFGVSRHAFIVGSVARENRGRAIAIFGGTFRLGRFFGPAMGGVIAAHFGLRAPFLLYGGLNATALLLVLVFTTERETGPTHAGAMDSPPPLLTMLRTHYRSLLTAGSGQLLAQMARAGWRIIIPLFGADMLGLDVDQIGLIVSLMAAVDTVLFMPTGMIMDRWGRKFAIVPSFLLQAAGLALVPLATGFAGLLGAALVIGFGNGLGAGTMMTVGADLAPENAQGEFLG
ncbi:MAG: MFS transporter, partial [Anaerolineae bacterium]|nr:MFS transporter [Anaerolineae bacterium]